MPRLLHLDASPRGPRSRSNMVAERLLAQRPDIEIEYLNLFDAELPAFDGATIEGRYALIAGEAVDPSVEAQWREIGRLIEHFLSFDGWVMTVPMWNFGIPYPLKHYVDLVTQPGMSFRVVDGQGEGLAAGRKAVLITSGALDIRPGGPMAALDHQHAFLTGWLGFIGVTDIETVHVKPTFGPPEAVEPVMAAAYAEADALASRLFRPDRV